MKREDMDGFHVLIICTMASFRGPEASILTKRPHHGPAAADMQRDWSREGQLSVAALEPKYIALQYQTSNQRTAAWWDVVMVSCLSAGGTHLD